MTCQNKYALVHVPTAAVGTFVILSAMLKKVFDEGGLCAISEQTRNCFIA
jgi:hypothetical protein